MNSKKQPLYKSFKFAFKGLKIAWSERNFKFHIISTVIAIVLGFILEIGLNDWMIILLCIGLVLSLEILNTAIEYLVDLVSPGINEIAGKVKDLSAAAVLVASIISAIIACIVFLPYLY